MLKDGFTFFCMSFVQVEVLTQQLELAKELNKPASIHCVRAFGDLLELMKYAYLLLSLLFNCYLRKIA